MKLMIVNGSARVGRASDKIQDWVVDILKEDADLELDIVDLKEVNLPFYDEPLPPSANNGQFQNPKGTAWAKRVAEADAFLFLTAEYNHGPTAILKNALDWVYEGWQFKPAGFVSYGAVSGGIRAVQQLKLNLLHLKVFPVNYNVHIPLWGGGANENGRPVERFDDNLRKVVADIKALQQRLKV
jgi:NAD(P)H-dependent FMN reductase